MENMTCWELLTLLLALETLIEENNTEKTLRVFVEIKAELKRKD